MFGDKNGKTVKDDLTASKSNRVRETLEKDKALYGVGSTSHAEQRMIPIIVAHKLWTGIDKTYYEMRQDHYKNVIKATENFPKPNGINQIGLQAWVAYFESEQARDTLDRLKEHHEARQKFGKSIINLVEMARGTFNQKVQNRFYDESHGQTFGSSASLNRSSIVGVESSASSTKSQEFEM